MNPDDLLRLAGEYRAACVAMKTLWADFLRAPPESDERTAARSRYNDGRRRVDTTKHALLAYANGGAKEIGG